MKICFIPKCMNSVFRNALLQLFLVRSNPKYPIEKPIFEILSNELNFIELKMYQSKINECLASFMRTLVCLGVCMYAHMYHENT
jgi:hypothetical protein